MTTLFKYSGNKTRLVRDIRPPPIGTRRIVEPFLGSGAYTLNWGLPGLGVDADPRVVGLWHWLQRCDPEELREADRILQAEKKASNLDIRNMPLSDGQRLYLKVNVCSLVVGQWSSWKVYPQNRLPLDKTIEALPRARQVEVRLGDARDVVAQEGDLLFVDPPYIGTSGNYLGENRFDPDVVRDLLKKNDGVPTIVTYGDGAELVFPELPWEQLKVRRVPNVRSGGVVERRENVAYLNFLVEVDFLTQALGR